MSSFDVTLFLLKEKKEPRSFMIDFNEKLKSINVLLEKNDYEIIVFNDSRNEEEKEHIYLNESMTDEEIIDWVCSWKGLGLLSYRHPDFSMPLSINYLSWDDEYLYGFDVGFASTDTVFKKEKHEKLMAKISEFIDYEYIVGNVENLDLPGNNIGLQSLDKIKELILNNSFKIDSRTW
jgi:hypothetical protein